MNRARSQSLSISVSRVGGEIGLENPEGTYPSRYDPIEKGS